MHSPGHVGVGLLLWSPIGTWLGLTGEPLLGIVGAGIAAAFSTVPDIDEFLPLSHRGITHSVVFVILIGIVVGLASITIGWLLGSTSVAISAVVTGAAVLSVAAHIAVDSLTPMGISPLVPFSDRHITFSLTPSKHPQINLGLLLAGVGSVVVGAVVVYAFG